MSPATSTQVRRRAAVRRDALARQHKLNEERRRQDEHEVELAVRFALSGEAADAARAALQAAELAMGQVVDQLVGQLRIRYPRAAELLEVPEDELKRLRQLAVDDRHSTEPPQRAAPRSRRGRAPRATPTTAETARGTDGDTAAVTDLAATG